MWSPGLIDGLDYGEWENEINQGWLQSFGLHNSMNGAAVPLDGIDVLGNNLGG